MACRAWSGLVIVLLFAACGGGGEEARPTKDDVITGKVDTNVDWCEEMDWYGDGECDTFCLRPDPDCGPVPDADAEIDALEDALEEDDPAADVPDEGEVPPAEMSLAEVTALASNLVTAMYEHGTKYMGWAHYSNNCFIRMRAVYYYANFGELPQYDETETAPQTEMMDRIQALEHSPVYEIMFMVAGSLRLQGTFQSDDTDVQGHLSAGFDTTWTNHYGALIYTEAGPRIVDIAFSNQPMTMDEWQQNFLPGELLGTCAFNDAEAKSAILDYTIKKSLGQNPPVPEPGCVFMVSEIFRNEDGTPFDDTDLFPYMWNDVHEMAVSTSFVTSSSGDTFYFMSNPEKVPLVRLQTTSATYSP